MSFVCHTHIYLLWLPVLLQSGLAWCEPKLKDPEKKNWNCYFNSVFLIETKISAEKLTCCCFWFCNCKFSCFCASSSEAMDMGLLLELVICCRRANCWRGLCIPAALPPLSPVAPVGTFALNWRLLMLDDFSTGDTGAVELATSVWGSGTARVNPFQTDANTMTATI